MHLSVPLKQVSVEEKLQATGEIGAELAGTTEKISAPAWHIDVLQVREERIIEWRVQFLDIEEPKKCRMGITQLR